MDIKDIAARLQNGYQVTHQERAYLVRNNPAALAAFMIDNNPGSVNMTLRQLGYDHLKFEPDKKALARQLAIFIDRPDQENLKSFEAVKNNFILKSDGLPTEYVKELYAQFNS